MTAAAAALCSAAALPAHAAEFDPGDVRNEPSSAPRSSTLFDPFADPTSDSYADDWEAAADGGTRVAASSGTLKVTPSTAAPGAEVEIRVQGVKGAKDTRIRARSKVFVADAELASDAGGALFAEAKIRSTAAPGRYKITCDCKAEGTITVVAPHDSPTDSPTGSPTAPVRAGGGGTAALGADAMERQNGPGVVHFIVAAGLAGGAGLAVAGIALRRRRANSAGD
ncbi:hypothetical protein [Streptomyces sp. 8N616]|uniref:hypothetical protein n=1 Tax=Streptomyces sp. 8N616 TaxID=3457414 RepID=UPI003FD06205